MERFNFATLVTAQDGCPTATHLPFLVYPEAGDQGCLVGHMARANAQWEGFAHGQEALVIFQGHHAYISPSWYELHPSVPTWNYAVVHAYGVPQVITDEDRVRRVLRALVDKHEGVFAKPWTMDLPAEYVGKMIHGIVAFEIPIARLEGKFKLSQNRPASERERVVKALATSADPTERGVASLMQETL
jgi:transcriptional regulator